MRGFIRRRILLVSILDLPTKTKSPNQTDDVRKMYSISINNVVLDYPRKKKGVGLFREILTGRMKKYPIKKGGLGSKWNKFDVEKGGSWYYWPERPAKHSFESHSRDICSR